MLEVVSAGHSALAVWLSAWLLELQILLAIIKVTMAKLKCWYIFKFYPDKKEKIIEEMSKQNQMEETALTKEQWQDTVVTYQAWKQICRVMALDMRKTARQDGPVCDAPLHRLDGTPCSLAQLQRRGRPLVIFFGSCS